ncbi:hypothetical protein M378DRAFT_27961 [Amanita muscaria Koide BX008]|uniref:Uncharacterized protein n=1 Tax=Amanita muscaria (strain Koide BX008) TaxID=946122 RepID=A0A0C2S470_AMAMK|nr:hypothetical protein M378DRAFT_27961 [Amanita muscaria Koide BX008]
MVAFKLTFVLSATVFSAASLTYAAPTTHRAELEARTFEDALEHFFARDLQQRPSSVPPATVSSLQGVTSTFGSTVKPHRKDKKVLAAVPNGTARREAHINSKNYHGDHQRHRVLSNTIDGANTIKPAKYVTTASQTHDSTESHPRLNKRLPPFPSKHHCPVCHKTPRLSAGHCKDHQWVCDDHAGRPWVQGWSEKCQNCGSSPPKKCSECGKKNPR